MVVRGIVREQVPRDVGLVGHMAWAHVSVLPRHSGLMTLTGFRCSPRRPLPLCCLLVQSKFPNMFFRTLWDAFCMDAG